MRRRWLGFYFLCASVWLRLDGRNLVVQASTKLYGGTWQITPDNLSSTGQDAISPQIAVDGLGNCTVVWAWPNSIQSSTKPYGGTWQTTQDTLSLPGRLVTSPRVIATSSGIAAAVWAWMGSAENGCVVQISTTTHGGSWQEIPSDLSQSTLENPSSPNVFPMPCLVVDSNGNSTALW